MKSIQSIAFLFFLSTGMLAFSPSLSLQGQGPLPKPIAIPSPVSGIVVELLVKPGDTVSQGQVLARLDDRKAALEVEAARIKVEIAKAEARATRLVFEEALVRYSRAELLYKKGSLAREELTAAKLTSDRYSEEMASKEAGIKLADVEVRKAELLRDLHLIRSPVAGTVRVVFKSQGEAIDARKTMLEIGLPDPKSKANSKKIIFRKCILRRCISWNLTLAA